MLIKNDRNQIRANDHLIESKSIGSHDFISVHFDGVYGVWFYVSEMFLNVKHELWMFYRVHIDKLTVYDQLYAQNVGYNNVTIKSSIKPSRKFGAEYNLAVHNRNFPSKNVRFCYDS